MVWVYIVVAVVLFLLLEELIRLPTVGKYGERYVFITGCDTGFGNLLAKRLDSLGFNVFAACYTEKGEDELRKVSSERLRTLSLDVSSIESVMKARECVLKCLPPDKGLWAVVNNAGIVGNIANSEMLTRADYETCLDVNLYGLIDVTRIFQPLVRKSQGRFVNMASVAGRMAVFFCPYAISKFGVEAFSDCLRRELLKQGVTVHLLEPSFFKTDIVNLEIPVKKMHQSYSQADRDVQMYYGKDFVERTHNELQTLIEKSQSTKTNLVIDAYTHAITAMFPRYRYVIGWDRYLWMVLWNMPEWVPDWYVGKTMVTPEGARRQ